MKTIALVFCILFAVAVNADHTFTFDLFSFNSSSSVLDRTSSGSCCVCCEDPASNISTCPSPCNVTLLVCVRDAGHSQNDNDCPRGVLVVPASSSGMQFSDTFPGPWTNEIQILIRIFHYDPSDPQLASAADLGTAASQRMIDIFVINELLLLPSAPPTPPTVFPALLGQVTFSGSFQVRCALGFFGPGCNLRCESRDDALGHFTCDPVTGLRVCLEGYVGMEDNCTQCVPSAGCSDFGGFCEVPGECRCLSGFSGENCSDVNGPTPTTASIQLATTVDDNFITSTAGIPSTFSTQSTVMSQPPFTSRASLPASSVLGLPSPSPDPTPMTTPDPTPTGTVLAASMLTSQPSPSIAAQSSMKTISTPSPRSGDVQSVPGVMPTNDVGSNRAADEGGSRLLYIVIGAAAGGVAVALVSLVAFVIVLVAVSRRHRKRKAKREQQTNESRFTDVISNIGTSSRFTSNATLNKTDPYLDTVVTPARDGEDSDPVTTLPRPTHTTFQHEDSGILTEDSQDAEANEESMYATPSVITNSGTQTPDTQEAAQEDHEYAVLECMDLTEGAHQKEDSVMDETDLLDSIERMMLHINRTLEDEQNAVPAESDSSFIYADLENEEHTENDIRELQNSPTDNL